MPYIDAANYNRIKSMRGFPIGTIIPYSGSTENIPKGWISCTGTNLNAAAYPLLYQCIGNTYGGTPGSTFALPALNNRAVMDIFQGHYQYLRTTSATYPNTGPSGLHPMQGLTSASWSPNLTSTQITDLYWNQIGAGTTTPGAGGDTGSSSQTTYVSTMDLVGQRATLSTTLSATVKSISLTEGDYTIGFNILERKLGDGHWPQHAHGVTVPGEQSQGHVVAGGQNQCVTPWTGNCYGPSPECPNGQYAVSYQKYSSGQNHFRCGGGSIGSVSEGNGTGCSGGDMLSAGSGVRKFQTNLNIELRNFTDMIGHNHGTVNLKFTSKLVAQANFSLNTIAPGSVNIDNSSGINAATINMSSLTPTVTMIFIIKAF